MTAREFKLCWALAQSGVELPDDDGFNVMCGFGLPDFVPVQVTIAAVARCMRWQCGRFDGTWDLAMLAHDRPSYLKNIDLLDLTAVDSRDFVLRVCNKVLGDESDNS